MKKHLVNILFKTPQGNYNYCGWVNEVIGDSGKAIFYPCALFKQAFGFELPIYSKIIQL